MELDFNELSKIIEKDKFSLVHIINCFEKPYLDKVKVIKVGNTYVFRQWDSIVPITIGKEEELVQILEQLPRGEYFFEAVREEYSDIICRHFKDVSKMGVFNTFYLKPEHEYPESADITALTEEDIDVIDDHWPYQWKDEEYTSKDFFKDLIGKNHSARIEVDGELAAWAIMYRDTQEITNYGHLFVLEKFRHRGYAKAIFNNMLNYTYKVGKTAVVHIKDDNVASETLTVKYGFNKDKPVFWGTGTLK